jgi:hypothetical protein
MTVSKTVVHSSILCLRVFRFAKVRLTVPNGSVLPLVSAPQKRYDIRVVERGLRPHLLPGFCESKKAT